MHKMSKFCPLAMSKLNLKLALQQTTSVWELVFDNDNKLPKKWGKLARQELLRPKSVT